MKNYLKCHYLCVFVGAGAHFTRYQFKAAYTDIHLCFFFF